jgi:uncharacterized integral membrane protein (TIGR00698 family)
MHMFRRAHQWLLGHFRGILACALIAVAATFLHRHYGGPQLLYALLIGLAFHFLSKDARVKPGVNFCARSVLRLGVALLGARITLAQVGALGWQTAALVLLGLLLTIALGVVLARALGRSREDGLLSGGAVAICGASAALAISSVLPRSKDSERMSLLVVVSVTLLSTLAMVLYPFILRGLSFSPVQQGVFLGGTIHDVAQVVAAGMMLGPQAGDTATVVKLFRVMMLAPVVFAVALFYSRSAGVSDSEEVKDGNLPLVPGFLLAFIVLMLLASTGVLAPAWVQAAGDTSRAALVVAIAAAGVKTSFEDILQQGWTPVLLLLLETLFIAAIVLAGLFLGVAA